MQSTTPAGRVSGRGWGSEDKDRLTPTEKRATYCSASQQSRSRSASMSTDYRDPAMQVRQRPIKTVIEGRDGEDRDDDHGPERDERFDVFYIRQRYPDPDPAVQLLFFFKQKTAYEITV